MRDLTAPANGAPSHSHRKGGQRVSTANKGEGSCQLDAARGPELASPTGVRPLRIRSRSLSKSAELLVAARRSTHCCSGNRLSPPAYNRPWS
jgi:hypothetical protein